MTDPIADFITRIRNAYMARHETVVVGHSTIKKALADILVTEGYIQSVELDSSGKFDNLVVTLKYINGKPAVTGIKRVSKPGRRLYAKVSDIPQALGGYGSTLVSTSKGILTDVAARKHAVGGELMCQVW